MHVNFTHYFYNLNIVPSNNTLKYSYRLDKLLDGGFRTGEVVEVYGRSGQGKTQLMIHTTILACFRQRCHAIYIDTSNSFCTRRATEILHKYNKNIQAQ